MRKDKRIKIRPYMPEVWRTELRFMSWLPRTITKKMVVAWYGPKCGNWDDMSSLCVTCQGHKLWEEQQDMTFGDFTDEVDRRFYVACYQEEKESTNG